MISKASGSIVIDTNVVSHIFNRNNEAAYYIEKMHDSQWIISFQTLEELWYGAYSKGWGSRRKTELAHHLERYKVIWPDEKLVYICARLRQERKSVGRVMGQADAWIAATALSMDCPLASSDRDFSGIPELDLIQAA